MLPNKRIYFIDMFGKNKGFYAEIRPLILRKNAENNTVLNVTIFKTGLYKAYFENEIAVSSLHQI